jgi:hypothetical protein
MAHPGGRPLIFETPDDLKTAVDLYFASADKRITLAGLALALDIDRQTLYNYAERDEFFDIIKKARERVEAAYEDRLIYENNPTGVIFALKNMNWQDKTQQDLAISGGITWNEQKTYVSPEGPMETKSGITQKVLHTKGGDVPM